MEKDFENNDLWEELMPNVVWKKILVEGNDDDANVEMGHLLKIEVSSVYGQEEEETNQIPKVVEVLVGDMVLLEIDHGIMLALKSMKPGETSLVKVKDRFTLYNKDVIHTVTLLENKGLRENLLEMELEKYLHNIKKYRERGNEFFNNETYADNLQKASTCYSFGRKSIEQYTEMLLSSGPQLDSESEKYIMQLLELKLKFMSNLSLIYEKQKRYNEVLKLCEQFEEEIEDAQMDEIKSLKIKNCIRKSRNLQFLGRWSDCKKYLLEMLKIFPKEDGILRELAKIKKRIQSQNKKDKEKFEGAFEKLKELSVDNNRTQTENRLKEEKTNPPSMKETPAMHWFYKNCWILCVYFLPILLYFLFYIIYLTGLKFSENSV
eukprot:snap_masked-scaffold_25-processed-gene-2.43-mRNA-1 protein AED:1.00 eAED:1.00 QI:0/-1/0/0/-1/1/1/0/376